MSNAAKRILIVEDEGFFAAVVREIVLDEGAGNYTATVVDSLAEAKSFLAASSFDLVLLDLSLPDQQGVETYRELYQAAPHLPVIVLTGLSDEETALQTLRAGAQDYLMKHQFDGRLLGRAIRYAMERKSIELRLRESEEFFRLISENVTDLISVLDVNGQRLYSSPSYQTVLGREKKLAGTSAFDEIHAEDRDAIRGVFQEVIASGQGQRAEYRFVRPDGVVRHVESQSSVIRDDAGATQKVVVVARDVTERMKAEEELRRALAELRQSHEQLKTAQKKVVQSEKLEAVSTFAAGVAHEVKNPLQTVILGIDYLTDYVITTDENAADLLKQMRDAVNRADAIIHGLVEFSSYRKEAVSDQNLGELLEQSFHAVETEFFSKGVKVQLDLAPTLPALRLDKRSLKHVLINLLVTESHAFGSGGELSIRTRTRELTNAEQGGLASAEIESLQKSTVVIAEIESRHGTPPGGSSHLDTKEDALLARADFGNMVSRKLIELYGGKMECIRQKSGSKFTISFQL